MPTGWSPGARRSLGELPQTPAPGPPMAWRASDPGPGGEDAAWPSGSLESSSSVSPAVPEARGRPWVQGRASGTVATSSVIPAVPKVRGQLWHPGPGVEQWRPRCRAVLPAEHRPGRQHPGQEGQPEGREQRRQHPAGPRQPDPRPADDVRRPGPPQVGALGVVALQQVAGRAGPPHDPMDHHRALSRISLGNPIGHDVPGPVGGVRPHRHQVTGSQGGFHALARDDHVGGRSTEICGPQGHKPHGGQQEEHQQSGGRTEPGSAHPLDGGAEHGHG